MGRGRVRVGRWVGVGSGPGVRVRCNNGSTPLAYRMRLFIWSTVLAWVQYESWTEANAIGFCTHDAGHGRRCECNWDHQCASRVRPTTHRQAAAGQGRHEHVRRVQRVDKVGRERRPLPRHMHRRLLLGVVHLNHLQRRADLFEPRNNDETTTAGCGSDDRGCALPRAGWLL